MKHIKENITTKWFDACNVIPKTGDDVWFFVGDKIFAGVYDDAQKMFCMADNHGVELSEVRQWTHIDGNVHKGEYPKERQIVGADIPELPCYVTGVFSKHFIDEETGDEVPGFFIDDTYDVCELGIENPITWDRVFTWYALPDEPLLLLPTCDCEDCNPVTDGEKLEVVPCEADEKIDDETIAVVEPTDVSIAVKKEERPEVKSAIAKLKPVKESKMIKSEKIKEKLTNHEEVCVENVLDNLSMTLSDIEDKQPELVGSNAWYSLKDCEQILNDLLNNTLNDKYGDKSDRSMDESKKHKSLKKIKEDYGWEVEYGHEWDLYEEMLDSFGAEELLDSIVRAMSRDDLGETLAYICRMHDFESDYLVNEDEDDEEDFEESQKKMKESITLPARYFDRLSGKFPSAGPNPSIKGMKDKVGYGKQDHTIVKCGGYIFNVPDEEVDKILNESKKMKEKNEFYPFGVIKDSYYGLYRTLCEQFGEEKVAQMVINHMNCDLEEVESALYEIGQENGIFLNYDGFEDKFGHFEELREMPEIDNFRVFNVSPDKYGIDTYMASKDGKRFFHSKPGLSGRTINHDDINYWDEISEEEYNDAEKNYHANADKMFYDDFSLDSLPESLQKMTKDYLSDLDIFNK